MNKLVARGRMGSYALSEGRKDHFYTPTPLGEEISSKGVTDNLNEIQSTLLNMNDSTEKRLEELEKFVLNFQAWPVGSIFIGLDDVNPAVKIGYGNWVLTSGGRCLVGAGDGKSLGDTGGSTSVTLSEANMPAHKHDITVSDFGGVRQTDVQGGVRQTDGQGAHTHNMYDADGIGHFGNSTVPSSQTSNYQYGPSPAESMFAAGHHAHNIDINHAHNVDISHGHGVSESIKGSGSAFNIENPYLVVSIWHRVS